MIYFFLWFDSLLKDFSWGLLHGNFFFKGWWHLVASIDSNTHLYEVIRHRLSYIYRQSLIFSSITKTSF